MFLTSKLFYQVRLGGSWNYWDNLFSLFMHLSVPLMINKYIIGMFCSKNLNSNTRRKCGSSIQKRLALKIEWYVVCRDEKEGKELSQWLAMEVWLPRF